MARNDIKNSSLLKTKFLIYAFNGRTLKKARPQQRQRIVEGLHKIGRRLIGIV